MYIYFSAILWRVRLRWLWIRRRFPWIRWLPWIRRWLPWLRWGLRRLPWIRLPWLRAPPLQTSQEILPRILRHNPTIVSLSFALRVYKSLAREITPMMYSKLRVNNIVAREITPMTKFVYMQCVYHVYIDKLIYWEIILKIGHSQFLERNTLFCKFWPNGLYRAKRKRNVTSLLVFTLLRR